MYDYDGVVSSALDSKGGTLRQTQTVEVEGLPSSIDAEKLVLGAVLMDSTYYPTIAAIISRDDFSLKKHKLIWSAVAESYEKHGKVDRVLAATTLQAHKSLDTVGGLSYIVSLDDKMPHVQNIEEYAHIVRDKSRLRQIIVQSYRTIEEATEQANDPAEIVSRASDRLLGVEVQSTQTGLMDPTEIVEANGGLNRYLSARPPGIKSGFERLDDLTNGFQPGELIVIAARPGMGKTALAMEIGQNVADNGETAAVFSLEMSKEQLLDRLACARAAVQLKQLKLGLLVSEERQRLVKSMAHLCAHPIYIDDTPGTNLMSMMTKLRKLRAEKGKLGLVIVDYLQLIETDRYAGNRVQEVSAISRGLKVMAKQLHVPVIALSQLSRKVEERQDKRPQQADLRESGGIEQDADVIGFIYRDEVYNPGQPDNDGVAEFILAKQRNGPTGTFKLSFIKKFARFANMHNEEYGGYAA